MGTENFVSIHSLKENEFFQDIIKQMALELLKSCFHVHDLKVTRETVRVAYCYEWEE